MRLLGRVHAGHGAWMRLLGRGQPPMALMGRAG